MRKYTFYMEDEQIAALKELQESTGVPVSESIRRAVAAWLAKGGEKCQKNA